MSLLWLIHPDPEVAKSLRHSLAQAWPELQIAVYAPDTVPAAMPAHAVALSFNPHPRAVLLDRPVKFKTMVLQVQSLMRTAQRPVELSLGGCMLNTRTREWTGQQGNAVMLTEKEVDLLVYLWQCDRAITRDDLLKDVWEYAAGVDTHTIETHIYRLRQKIEADPGNPQILVTNKDGYQLSATNPS